MTLFRDIFKVTGQIVGSIMGVPLAIIAETLGMTTDMVKEAVNAGCKTYDEIRDYFKE